MMKVIINDDRTRTAISRLNKTDFFLTKDNMLGMVLSHDCANDKVHCYDLTHGFYKTYNGDFEVLYIPEGHITIEVDL